MPITEERVCTFISDFFAKPLEEVDSIDMVRMILALQKEFSHTFTARQMEEIAGLESFKDIGGYVCGIIQGRTAV